MARKKIFFAYEVPASVTYIVRSVCVDYDRRAQAIRDGIKDTEILTRYLKWNALIDAALETVELGIREELFRDIQSGRGYDHSPISHLLSKNTYYNRRRQVIYEIARGLRLV